MSHPFQRKPLPHPLPSDFVVQITNVEYNENVDQLIDAKTLQPIVTLFCSTPNGNSVALFVQGFYPYMYVSKPPQCTATDLENIRMQLEYLLQQSTKNYYNADKKTKPQAQKKRKRTSSKKEEGESDESEEEEEDYDVVEEEEQIEKEEGREETPLSNGIVKRIEIVKKTIFFGYQSPTDLLKITVSRPRYITKLRGLFQDNFYLLQWTDYRYTQESLQLNHFQRFEANIQFWMRFCIDTDLMCMRWCRFSLRNCRPIAFPISTCQLSYRIHWKALQCIEDVSKLSITNDAPLRIFAFDTEWACSWVGNFPKGKTTDEVLTHLCADVYETSGKGTVIQRIDLCVDPTGKLVRPLRTSLDENKYRCLMLPMTIAYETDEEHLYQPQKTEVIYFYNSKDLMKALHQILIDIDPDFILGHNILGFDLPQLHTYADTFNLSRNEFSIGRIMNHGKKKTRSDLFGSKPSTFSSRAYGRNEGTTIETIGIVQFDTLEYYQRNAKMRLYNLNSLSMEYLNSVKDDIPADKIPDFFYGTDDQRDKLRNYCYKDTELSLRLAVGTKIQALELIIAFSKLTGLRMKELLHGGQGIRTQCLILKELLKRDMVLPYFQNTTSESDTESAFEGALVLEPIRGFHTDPVAVLDFQSLYPSIMMAHNLCYSTYVRKSMMKEAMDKFGDDCLEQTPNGDSFLKSSIFKGVLPSILEKLISERSKVKGLLKTCSEQMKKTLEAKSNALKLMANSIYGYTGAKFRLYLEPLSAGVTSWGREMLKMTKDEVENKLSKELDASKYETIVITGDTDSVMIKLVHMPFEESFKIGADWSKRISTLFPKPICLDFEKVYYPYLLLKKKRYIGYKFLPNDHQKGEMDSKGIESVRRDSCLLVSQTISSCMKILMETMDSKKSIEYAKEMFRKLYSNDVDLSKLVLTRGLSKSEKDYVGKQPHIEMIKRKLKAEKKRESNNPDSSSASFGELASGGRVSYVLVAGTKGSKNYENSEDPLYALENDIPLDTKHYATRLKTPLQKLFQNFYPSKGAFEKDFVESQFVHQKVISHNRGIAKFATVVHERCLGCKQILQPEELALCEECSSKKLDVYRNLVNDACAQQELSQSAWRTCHICKGSFHNEIICSAFECPNFYYRFSVRKKMETAQDKMSKFDKQYPSSWADLF